MKMMEGKAYTGFRRIGIRRRCRVKCGVRGKSGSLKCREFGAGQKCGVTCKVRGAGRRSTSLVVR